MWYHRLPRNLLVVLSSTLSILPKSTSSSTAVVFFFSFLVNFSLVGKDDASPHFIPKIFNGPDSTLRRILNVRQISMVWDTFKVHLARKIPNSKHKAGRNPSMRANDGRLAAQKVISICYWANFSTNSSTKNVTAYVTETTLVLRVLVRKMHDRE